MYVGTGNQVLCSKTRHERHYDCYNVRVDIKAKQNTAGF